MPVEIELQTVMTLPREGIVITRYATKPRQGFALRDGSTLNGFPIASLTIAKAVDATGARQDDLVSFRLAHRADCANILPGQCVVLREVDPAGLFDD